jgi:hypothetical protein
MSHAESTFNVFQQNTFGLDTGAIAGAKVLQNWPTRKRALVVVR